MSSKLSFSIAPSKSKGKSNSSTSSVSQADNKQNGIGSDFEKANGTGASKVSFSISSSGKPKAGGDGSTDENNRKHYVTEFDSSKTLTDPSKSEPVIPPIPNSWRPIKRMKNLELPLTETKNSDGIGFVVESLPASIGSNDDGGMSYGLNVRQKTANEDGNDEAAVGTGEDIESILLRKLRYDIDNLPDHRGMEEFEDMPVEGFGAAVLRGYGWKEGQGIGKNAKEDIKVKQYEKRLGTFGLGFVPEKHDATKRNEKHSSTTTTDRSQRDGRDKTRHSKDAKESRTRKEKASDRISWLRRQIRVRIISKNFKGGKFYLKKGVVVDVVEPHVCDVSMDESGELLQGVDQDLLETALPRKGGVVLVLYDQHKGVCGNLVKRDLDRGVGVVEDSDSFELLNVKLDQIAEYVGGRNYE